jgi:predicted DNA binding protein
VDSIAWYDLTPVSETSFYAYVCQETRAADERWRAAFARRDLVVVPPITYDAASVMGCAIVGGAADLRALLEGLSAAIDMTVERLGEYDHRYGTITEGVTDRQLAVLGTAVELGYYDTPWTATLREVAAAADCAPSTASNHLRKTE